MKKLGLITSITNNAADTILRLPIYPELNKDEQVYIINNLEKIFAEL